MYENMPITKDKALNEITDGYDAESVPDNLIADRLNSASYVRKTRDGNSLVAQKTSICEAFCVGTGKLDYILIMAFIAKA